MNLNSSSLDISNNFLSSSYSSFFLSRDLLQKSNKNQFTFRKDNISMEIKKKIFSINCKYIKYKSSTFKHSAVVYRN